MKSILVITSSLKDEFTSIFTTLAAPVISANFSVAYAVEFPQSITSDIVILGIDDYGSAIYTHLSVLSEAHDVGKGIIFTHSKPAPYRDRVVDETLSFEEQLEAEQLHREEYLTALQQFGLESFTAPPVYNFYNSVRIVLPSHTIVTSPFLLGTGPLSVQLTHNLGWTLSAQCQIVMDNSLLPSGNDNYYLATYAPLNKGKIVHCMIGHNYYHHDTFYALSRGECRIIANILNWVQ